MRQISNVLVESMKHLELPIGAEKKSLSIHLFSPKARIVSLVG